MAFLYTGQLRRITSGAIISRCFPSCCQPDGRAGLATSSCGSPARCKFYRSVLGSIGSTYILVVIAERLQRAEILKEKIRAVEGETAGSIRLPKGREADGFADYGVLTLVIYGRREG